MQVTALPFRLNIYDLNELIQLDLISSYVQRVDTSKAGKRCLNKLLAEQNEPVKISQQNSGLI